MNLFKQIITQGLLQGILLALLITSCQRPKGLPGKDVVFPFAGIDSAQVDSVLNVLTLEEKIGQLIIWSPGKLDSNTKNIIFQQVSKGRVGGLIFDNLEIADFLFATDSCRRISPLPMFFGTRQKVSLNNQFSGVPNFPHPATLAAIDSSGLHRQIEEHFWKQCKASGINFVFGPTLKMDDPEAAGFDYQTFENDPAAMMERSNWTMQNLLKHRIMAVGDCLSGLQFISNDTIRDSLLQYLIFPSRSGLTGLMVDDKIFVSDSIMNRPPRFLKNYLSDFLDFNGLIITNLGPMESPAFKLYQGAGLFVTAEPQKTFYAIVKMIERGRLSELDLDKKVRQVLVAKAWVNGGRLPVQLDPVQQGDTVNMAKLVSFDKKPMATLHPLPKLFTAAKAEQLHCYFEDPNWGFFIRSLYERSIVLANNTSNTIPLTDTYSSHFHVFEYTRRQFIDFKYLFSKYAPYESKRLPPDASGALKPVKFDKAEEGRVVVAVLDSIDLQPGFHEPFITSLNELSLTAKVILVNYGNPKNLRHFHPSVATLQCFERNSYTEAYAAQLLFGGVPALGRLPVAVSKDLPYGTAIYQKPVRLGFSNPEAVGIEKERLVGINAIAETAIDKGVFPGCQVVMAKDGQVIFSKSFGDHTYGKKQPVQKTDLYDIASVTKIAATTLAVMKLAEEKKLALNGKVGDYLTLDDKATVKDIEIKELLQHQSGLQAQMPIARYLSWRNVPARGCNDYFCKKQQRKFDVLVASGLYLREDYPDSIWKKVYHLPVSKKKSYHYSDVNFFLLQKIVETLSGTTLDDYVSQTFYRPLGLHHTAFKPLERFRKGEIVPTENDRTWRKTLVQGTVHDPSAALMGGVGGSAGVFANAEDLAALFQMLLNGGAYGGTQFLQTKTIEDFTAHSKVNHRGLGFDKPVNRRYPTYSRHIASSAYGHTGFTGTCVWVDPKSNIVYIFLSNRVHPNSRNGKIFTEAVRGRIHEVLYDALGSFSLELPQIETDDEVIEGE